MQRFEIRPIDAALFAAERERLFAKLALALATLDADVREVGSTAVEGVIGKGDLDVLVRVPAARFEAARSALDAVIDRNPDQLSNEAYQGYRVASELDVAVQLTVLGGPYDDFVPFLDRLREDRSLRDAYNALKREWDGRDMTGYREAKRAFIEGGLRGLRRAAITTMAMLAMALVACENRVSSTRQCLGNGGRTTTYERYTFEIDEGPALEVAGNCRVVLVDCNVRAPEGVRASEGAIVEVRGGTFTATRGNAVTASGRARVSFTGTAVVGAVQRADSAEVTGIETAR
ncbi:MAG: GrpB family protein [Polyangiales bacterium]